MTNAQSSSSRRSLGFVVGVAAAIISGIVLAWLIPTLQQPKLVAAWALTSDQPGTTKIVLDVHNDGDRTVIGCIGNWMIVDKTTGQQLASFSSGTFDVPAHSAAVPDYGTDSKPFIRVSNGHLPPTSGMPVNIVMDITCGGYRTEIVDPTNW